MTTAVKTTKHIIQAYKAVRRVEELTQAKLDALLETNAFYKLFEPDTEHPYYVLASAGQNTISSYEALIAGVLDWTIGSGTIAEELDKAKARLIVDDEKAEDDDLDALRLIQTARFFTRYLVRWQKTCFSINHTLAAYLIITQPLSTAFPAYLPSFLRFSASVFSCSSHNSTCSSSSGVISLLDCCRIFFSDSHISLSRCVGN